jgi:hypothetical protein
MLIDKIATLFNYLKKEAVSKVHNLRRKVILNLFQDLIRQLMD